MAEQATIFITDPTAEAERVASALRARGYAVVDVPLGLLLARVAVQRPSLVLLDIDAEGAPETVARLREGPSGESIEVLFVGEQGRTVVDTSDAVVAGASGFLPRPLDLTMVVRKVQALAPLDAATESSPSQRPSGRPPASIPPGSGPTSRRVAPAEPSLEPATWALGGGGIAITPQLSEELQRVLANAEARVEASGQQNSDPPLPEDEVDAILPPQMLEALEEPLLYDNDHGSWASSTPAHKTRGSSPPLEPPSQQPPSAPLPPDSLQLTNPAIPRTGAQPPPPEPPRQEVTTRIERVATRGGSEPPSHALTPLPAVPPPRPSPSMEPHIPHLPAAPLPSPPRALPSPPRARPSPGPPFSEPPPGRATSSLPPASSELEPPLPAPVASIPPPPSVYRPPRRPDQPEPQRPTIPEGLRPVRAAPPVEVPRVEAPRVEAPRVEAPRVEAPRAEPARPGVADAGPRHIEFPPAVPEPRRIEFPPAVPEPRPIESPRGEPPRGEPPGSSVSGPSAPPHAIAPPSTVPPTVAPRNQTPNNGQTGATPSPPASSLPVAAAPAMAPLAPPATPLPAGAPPAMPMPAMPMPAEAQGAGARAAMAPPVMALPAVAPAAMGGGPAGAGASGGGAGQPAAALPAAGVLTEGEGLRRLGRAVGDRFSGVLCFEGEGGLRRVVLRDGDLVTVGSSLDHETLVAFLEQRGELPKDMARKLAGRLPPFGRHAGAALVAHGHLSQDRLWEALRGHAEWLVGKALSLSEGVCSYEAEAAGRLRAEPSVFGGSTGSEVLVEVVRRVVAAPDALRRLGGGKARLGDGRRPTLLGECALSPRELELVERARGFTVAELLEAAPGPDMAAVLLALVALGVLDVLAPSEAESEAPPAPRDELDDEALRARVRARLALVEEGDYFAVLGVARSATPYEIKRAYLDLRRSFEPSRVLSPATADLVEPLRLILEVLDEAYEVLRDATRRERYRRAIEARPPED